MKIAIDGRLYGLENAGLGRYTVELIKNLKKDKENTYFLLLRKKYFKKLKLPENWTKVLTDYRHYSFEEQIKIPFLLKKINPDLTHYPHFNIPLFSPRPYVVTIHDMIMHHSKGIGSTTLPSYQYLLKRIGYKIVFWFAVNLSDKIIVPSLFVKKEIEDFFKIKEEKIKVTQMGISKSFFKIFKKIKKDDYFFYVGNAYPHKNLIRLIEVIKEENLKLKIVTSRNIFKERLQKQIIKLNAQNNIFVLDHIKDEKLKKLYQGAKAFVYPSIVEGFGFQGLEAMASRTLLLASDIKVFHEIYKNNAIYFNPENKKSITEVLHKIDKMELSAKNKMIQKAYKYAKRFSWKKTILKTLEIYKEALGLTA